ncbi:TetR/AcrR family transcriptional regulator [Dyella japonica]|uniref:TetR family transcriptional regulator n=1 Tax=Dyella japonica A8 TaxID=1217721 RepID=A0A075K289_9GAMM|nr:TetR/AcrR family transcriptional regulator [Dyella japonica]AIF47965.1 TetR family transcriptional regulator [Dyella japonica A8]
MARPRSEDKRNAILEAATKVFAEQGTSAPTARIARMAGVAEGTLFTYFESKDVLLNELYLTLKSGLREQMLEGYPHRASARERARHAWNGYVDWGVAHPEGRKVMAQLTVSERITEDSKTVGSAPFGGVQEMLREAMAKGVLREMAPAFVGALLSAMAEATISFIEREPKRAEPYRAAGFEAFWNAISKS